MQGMDCMQILGLQHVVDRMLRAPAARRTIRVAMADKVAQSAQADEHIVVKNEVPVHARARRWTNQSSNRTAQRAMASRGLWQAERYGKQPRRSRV